MIDGEALHFMQGKQDFQKKILVLFFQRQGKSVNDTAEEIKLKHRLEVVHQKTTPKLKNICVRQLRNFTTLL